MLTQKKTKAIMLGDTPVKRVMFRDKQIWPEESEFTGLCFTAEEANSTVQLNKNGSPTEIELEISTDGNTWSDYTIGDAITLANVGDKVYMRNKSETDTGFSTSGINRYQFAMTGTIASSGDITSLLNKNGTTTASNYCFFELFDGCTSLTTAPELPATTLGNYCYTGMFNLCTNLTTVPELPATTLTQYCYNGMFIGCESLTTPPALPATTLAEGCYYSMFEGCTSLTTVPELSATALTDGCYYSMFQGCTSLKVSTTQTGEYQIPYRIPTTGTGTVGTNSLEDMFVGTGGTFTGTPTINTTYYLRGGAAPVTTPGVYHNETEGLISLSSDGENWITIADRNLGATQVWNDGDEYTEANSGGFFQWGNNYMFPRTGAVNTSGTRVNIDSYGPDNYYSSDTFITWSNSTSDKQSWDLVNTFSINKNLWGGVTNTNEARKGPCQTGYHIPSLSEFNSLYQIFTALGQSGNEQWIKLFKLPAAGNLNYNSGALVTTSGACYWTSDRWSYDESHCRVNTTQYTRRTGLGYSIRPFKNEPVVPTSERTVLYQPENRTLFDETIISQSTSGSSGVIASRNGTIIRPSFGFSGGNGNYSITTQDGFDVISANKSHGNCCIGMSQSTYDSIMQNYSKIKLVCDYFNIGSQPSKYTNAVGFGVDEGIYATSAGASAETKWNGITVALNTPYSMEQIIDTATLTTTTTVTNLNTNTKQTVTYTKVFWKETKSSYIINGGGPQWIGVSRDSYGGPAVCGNIHIYTQ